jgi:hypothetical protein
MSKPLDAFKAIFGWSFAAAIVWILILILCSCQQKYYRYSHSGEKFKVEHNNQKR